MKKKLLIIAACAMALNAPVQAEMSHKTKTIASSVVAVLGAIGMGVTGKYWHDNAQKLENTDLSAAEREELNKVISKYQTAFVGVSVFTAGATAFAIYEGCGWSNDNAEQEKHERDVEKTLTREQRKDIDRAWRAYLKRDRQQKKNLWQRFGKKEGTRLWKARHKEEKDRLKDQQKTMRKFLKSLKYKTKLFPAYLKLKKKALAHDLKGLSTYEKSLLLHFDNLVHRFDPDTPRIRHEPRPPGVPHHAVKVAKSGRERAPRRAPRVPDEQPLAYADRVLEEEVVPVPIDPEDRYIYVRAIETTANTYMYVRASEATAWQMEQIERDFDWVVDAIG